MATSFDNMRKQQRADGFAAVLAIGTANPSNVVEQSTYPDYFFRVTGMEHETALKEKFRRICENSGIKKRYTCLTEDLLRQYPCLVSFDEPSLNARQKLLVKEMPRLAKEASEKAIKEWGRPISSITHLVFTTTSGVGMPGADYQLTMLLGLRPNVKRVTLYEQGCSAGATMLRVAKDLAENNRSARVLGVCSETTLIFFRGPSKPHFGSLLGPALFGDGASAVIVGADSIEYLEKPLFQMVWAGQVILPNSHRFIAGELLETGLTFEIGREVPNLISNNIEECLIEALDPLGISDWNSLFWVAHPGGPAILDQVEAKLKLEPEKLRSTRKVLSEYGNMSSAAVIFVLDEMRKWSAEMGLATTGEGLHWGVLFGFGPGITVETLVLRSMPL